MRAMSESDEKRFKRLARGYELWTDERLRELGFTPRSAGWVDLTTRMRRFVERQFLPHYFSRPPAWRLFVRGFGGPRVLPDFALIGPIKSGTSDLAVSLMLHPHISVPLAKEFDTTSPEQWRIFYPRRHRRPDQALKRAGYFSPYLHRMQLVSNFARACPNARIVLMLRDPVERAFSHYKWEVFLSGKRPDAPAFLSSFSAFIDLALDSFPDYPMYSASGFPLLSTGIYYKAVEVWMQRFGKANVLTLDVGRYFDSRRQVLDEIQDFIRVPRVALPDIEARINENPLKLGKADQATNERLTAFYRPYNEKLFTLLEERFAWRA